MPVFKVYNLGLSADRFSYLPLIGLFYLAGEAFAFLYHKKKLRCVIIISLFLINLFFSFITWNRCYVWKDSLSLINDAIKNYPTVPGLHFIRGNTFFIRQDYPNAVLNYSKAIELYPDQKEAYRYRGRSYVKIKDYSNAISDFTKILDSNPEDIEPYIYRSFSYYKKKAFKKAWEDVIKAENLGGEIDPEFIQVLKRNYKRPETTRQKNTLKNDSDTD
jgi:tetratricopeptide (TPR) repeat protein